MTSGRTEPPESGIYVVHPFRDMKTKNGRVRIECERGRTKFSEAEYRKVLAREEEAKQVAGSKRASIETRALHSKTA